MKRILKTFSIFGLLIMGGITYAEFSIPTSNIIPIGACGASFELKMVVQAKLDATHYVVSQRITEYTTNIGVIETTRALSPQSIVNMLLEYKGSKQFKGGDGFEHTADIWKECFKPYRPSKSQKQLKAEEARAIENVKIEERAKAAREAEIQKTLEQMNPVKKKKKGLFK